ncbi:hypothetical protein [Streptomyces sp. NPDC096132]|uniref:hypothetical protein n=1 Tax=Streptomyces sp. NPDC096132 TaxID=3366075 RepID=UPI0037F255B9
MNLSLELPLNPGNSAGSVPGVSDEAVRLSPVREDDLPVLERFLLDPGAAG